MTLEASRAQRAQCGAEQSASFQGPRSLSHITVHRTKVSPQPRKIAQRRPHVCMQSKDARKH